MHDDDDRPGDRPLRPLTPRRLVLTIVAALSLITLVVLASAGDRASGGSETGGETASAVLVNGVLLVLAILAAGVLVIVILSFSIGRTPRPKGRPGPGLVGQLLLLSAVLGLVMAWRAYYGDKGKRPITEQPELAPWLVGEKQPEAEQSEEASPPPDVDWTLIAVVFGVAVAAFTAAGVVMLRSGRPPEPSPALAKRLSEIFDDTLDDLRAERDPRRAVIAAYARMERLLGRHGLPRRPADAPHEYVARVLEELRASAFSVSRLTTLYERARFSHHDVDPLMKEEAIAAVAAVRDELSTAEAEPAIAAAR